MSGDLLPRAFEPLALGQVRPAGWLRDQLLIQADGLTGHLADFWPDVARSQWIGGDAEGWERGPYWLDGLIPLAVLIDDARLKGLAGFWVDQILASQRPDGWLGPFHDARFGYPFPGQGSGRGLSGGALRRRFSQVEEVYDRAALPMTADTVATAVAQPRIVTGSLAGLRALSLFGLEATVAVGHSLGEISALHWAGALDDAGLLKVAGIRGRVMAEHSESGTMASLSASPDAVGALLGDLPVVIAAYNGPEQTVVAGTVAAIETVTARAERAGVGCTRLAVSHAFHSPLVAPAADVLIAELGDVEFRPIQAPICSTITGETLAGDADIPALLRRQIVDPVLFSTALELAAKNVDLFVEVGPGRVLSRLATGTTDVPAVPLDTDDESLKGLLSVVGAAFAVGATIDHGVLFHGRHVRPL